MTMIERFCLGVACALLLQACASTLPSMREESAVSNGYQERDIVYAGAGVPLGGTVTLPAGHAPRAAVVMLTGSGPQDRDCIMAGFPMFRVLARALAERGIASLRSDDRGTGKSGGSIAAATLDDFARDARAGLAQLRAQLGSAIPIGMLGHSEGGAVAPLAAAQSADVAFVVALAGPGVAVRANILAQTELLSRANGMPEPRIQREVAMLQIIMNTLQAGIPVESLRPRFLEKTRADIALMDSSMRRALGDGREHADILFRQQMEMMDTPWFRSLIAYDPAMVIPALACPVLALYGERDLQAPGPINAEGMRAALAVPAHAASSVALIPGINHLFQTATIGSPTEYPSLEKEFAPGIVERIAAWILQRE